MRFNIRALRNTCPHKNIRNRNITHHSIMYLHWHHKFVRRENYNTYQPKTYFLYCITSIFLWILLSDSIWSSIIRRQFLSVRFITADKNVFSIYISLICNKLNIRALRNKLYPHNTISGTEILLIICKFILFNTQVYIDIVDL